jgi:hypothetical protein
LPGQLPHLPGLDAGTLPCQPYGHGPNPCRKTAAVSRPGLRAATQTSPDAVEAALLQEAEHCEELSREQRAALADKLADQANHFMWRARKLAELAHKVRPPGWNPPGFPQ